MNKERNAVKAMKKSGSKMVKARLNKRGLNTVRQFTKQAQNMVDHVEVGSRTFPDKNVRQAARNILDSIENNLEALKVIAESTGDDEIVEIVEDMIDVAEGGSSVDDQPSDKGPHHEENGDEPEVEVEGLEVDLGGDIDETSMNG